MDIKDICNAGSEILDTVADAINRGDFSGLSNRVSSTVDHVVSQVKEEVNRGSYGTPTHQYGKTTYTRQGQAEYRRAQAAAEADPKPSAHPFSNAASRVFTGMAARPPANVVTRHPAGKIMGPLELGWGIFSTTGFGITAVIMGALLLARGGMAFGIMTAVFGLLTAAGITNIVRGSQKIGLVKRFYQYASLIGSRGYIAVSELASNTGQAKERVLKDLKRMTKNRMFPQGRLDAGQTTFMITQDAYDQYKAAEAARIERERQSAFMRREAGTDSNACDETTKRILAEGNEYICMVHGCNEKIPGAEMSEKLDRLELIMRRIFEHVEKHPESADALQKFMDYYLPTTKKLLQAYIDLDRQEISGKNISQTKREIEDTLDTINGAFEQLLDSMFEDTAWDISSDISVMKTMMAQEGLTGGADFRPS